MEKFEEGATKQVYDDLARESLILDLTPNYEN